MNGTYVVLAVFIAFLALVGGAVLVAAAWFFLSLRKSVEELVDVLKPLTGDDTIKQAMLAVIAMNASLPAIHGSVKAAAEAFGMFAQFAIGKQPPSPGAPPAPTPVGAATQPIVPSTGGEFIPPQPEPEQADEQLRQMLRDRQIELDEGRVPEPEADKINLAQA